MGLLSRRQSHNKDCRVIPLFARGACPKEILRTHNSALIPNCTIHIFPLSPPPLPSTREIRNRTPQQMIITIYSADTPCNAPIPSAISLPPPPPSRTLPTRPGPCALHLLPCLCPTHARLDVVTPTHPAFPQSLPHLDHNRQGMKPTHGAHPKSAETGAKTPHTTPTHTHSARVL